ncbi:MurR/RpiR family transcriptional regulator [Bordetella genomosp. 13]|uniref:Transcriptional regulator n=1 Tax=Bordetella genomosp. 13 TaxID=463040 RepID=A0A1W6ZD08_9BORD|nr:MurR/RpiR family transcriptional regulator [Bordetella genomosp. 13]ARP95273.1 transcriptional regulator [Bordetella genomosp. 13]
MTSTHKSARPASDNDAPPQAAALPATRGRIQSLLPTMGPVAQRIGEFVINHPDEVVHMSVSEVAERTESSEGSVIGFCKMLGAKGFQQLKILLAQEIVQPVQYIHEDLSPQDSVDAVVGKIFNSNIQTLQETASLLDRGALSKAVRLLKQASRIEIYGIGSSATIAEDAYYRMLRIGLNAVAVTDSHIQSISASRTGPDVATLTISHSGSSYETVLATRLAKEAGAHTVCITNFGKSPIQPFADVLLYTMARETRFRTEAMTSRLAQLAIIDTLIACLALTDYDTSVATLKSTFDVLSLKRY